MIEKELKLMGIVIAALVVTAIAAALLGVNEEFGVRRAAAGDNEKRAEPNIIPVSLAPESVEIQRSAGWSWNEQTPLLSYRIDDEIFVKRLYESLLGLERVEEGVAFHCPNDDGSAYEMVFYEKDQEVLRLNAHRTGCAFVSFDGWGNYRSNDALWGLMKEADRKYGEPQSSDERGGSSDASCYGSC